MRYQTSKIQIIATERPGKGKSAFAAWVRENHPNKYIVSVLPFDTDGNFAHEPLKARGYEFSGAGKDHIEKGLLVGKKHWFKIFETEDEADMEVELLEAGI